MAHWTRMLAPLALAALWLAALPAGAAGRAQAADPAPLEQQVVELTNAQRRANGLPPLKLQANLGDAARWLAQDMADYNYFSHTDRLGRSIGQRFPAFGYSGYSTIGENISAGYGTPQAALDGWMNSSGHRANILNGSFCEIGAGYGANTASTYGRYWVQTFGCRFNTHPLIINDEAAQTATPQVSLYIYGSGWAQEMRLSNDGSSWGAWEPYQSARSWTLAGGSGARTVFVELRRDGTVRSASDTIELTGGAATATPTATRAATATPTATRAATATPTRAATATPAASRPSMPADLRVTSSTASQIALGWRDTSANESGFRIYRWESRNGAWDFYPHAEVGANATSFTAQGLGCARSYYYLLTAFNAAGESPRTAWVEGRTAAC